MNAVIVPAPPPVLAPTQQLPLPPDFNGQWVGPLYGETPGIGVIELETMGGLITGTAYLNPVDPAIVPPRSS